MPVNMDTGALDILSPDKSIALKASAGSGKTFNLSLRVVNLLLSGVEPDRILCLTFTNKATNEMYERIIKTLTYLAHELPEESGQGSLQAPKEEALMLAEYWMLRGAGKEPADVLRYLSKKAESVYEKTVREISRLRVSTIDSFFNSVLRLFPFEAGVLPDFRIITESEEDGIYRSAYDEFIAGIHSDDSMRQLLTNLVLLSGSAELSPFRVLDGYFREMLSIRTEIEGREQEVRSQESEVRGLLGEFDVLRGLEKKVREEAASLAARMRRFYPDMGKRAISELKKYEESRIKNLPALTSLTKEQYTDYRYFSSLEYLPEIQDAFDLLKEEMRDYFRYKNRIFQRITLYLFMRFLKYPDRTKQKLNALSFNDVTRICYNLLIGNALIDENPDYFYFRLDSRIEHLLIDEFQDTSIIQWKILKPVADELTSGMGQKERTGSFFYVGDPKQSIYRFRGGESRLFDAVLSHYPEKLKARSLRRNFRSGRVIVDFVNRVFCDVASHYGYDYQEQESTLEREGYVDVRFITRGKGADSAKACFTELKMQTVLSFVETLLNRGVLPGDIAILCQKNRTCEEYAGFLRDRGYDVLTESSEGLLEQPSVRAVMNLLKWLSDPRQAVYLFGFLFTVEGLLDEKGVRQLFHQGPSRGNLSAISPALSEKLSRLQSLSGLIPVYRLVERIIEEFDLHRAFNYDPNLLYLAGMATSEEISDPLGVEDLIAFMNSRSSTKALIPSGVSEKSVRLMTVHKAKGLEFPYVILPELDIRMTFDARKTPIIIDHNEDMTVKGLYLSENKDIAALVSGLNDVRVREEARIRTDRLNYLYVALTRARNGLMVVAEKSEISSDTRQLSDILCRVLQTGVQDTVSIYQAGSLPDKEKGLKPTVVKRDGTSTGPVGPVSFAGLAVSLKDMVQEGSSRIESPSMDDEGNIENPDEYRDRLFGEAFHYAVEMLGDFSADSIPAAIDRVRQRYVPLDEGAIMSIKRRLSSLVDNTAFLDLVHGQARLTEAPFARSGSLYRVDLLVFDGEIIRVMDFKTGHDASLPEGYIKQVNNYMQIVRECFKEGVSNVEGYLVFAGEDTVGLQEVHLQ
ncbi:Helicase [hydrothermal vent metagenome]|uniref:DNA 3'-5' helicase n=1 Tax=hydrothermal vent metagenome TaxID=652676 RepID=A0A3B1CWC9_9ZZZZ